MVALLALLVVLLLRATYRELDLASTAAYCQDSVRAEQDHVDFLNALAARGATVAEVNQLLAERKRAGRSYDFEVHYDALGRYQASRFRGNVTATWREGPHE